MDAEIKIAQQINDYLVMLAGGVCVISFVVFVYKGQRRAGVSVYACGAALLLVGAIFFLKFDSIKKLSFFHDTFSVDMGDVKADYENKFQLLERLVKVQEKKINILASAVAEEDNINGKRELQSELINIQNETDNIIKSFAKNSMYTILVFYRDGQRDAANSIATDLLKSGYKASATLTDLEESKRKLDPGRARVLFTPKVKGILSELERIYKKAAPNIDFDPPEEVSNLLRRDVQIYIF